MALLRHAKRVAMDCGRQNDQEWMINYTESCLGGGAMRWLTRLEGEGFTFWRILRQELLDRFSPPNIKGMEAVIENQKKLNDPFEATMATMTAGLHDGQWDQETNWGRNDALNAMRKSDSVPTVQGSAGIVDSATSTDRAIVLYPSGSSMPWLTYIWPEPLTTWRRAPPAESTGCLGSLTKGETLGPGLRQWLVEGKEKIWYYRA
ncbi:hypothetical protein FRB97_001783 [Tulasnella sp. 331]|nr:hypothetical protein FRB97_001783 [Tulasnella sp. 331]KAG8883282.1 hypothetical protein FRB98_003190 [Tulasnella sp. 332]